jgi:hypothetical protein
MGAEHYGFFPSKAECHGHAQLGRDVRINLRHRMD